MIVGSGIDLIEIARIQHSMDRYGSRFLNRVYTQAEQDYCLRKRNAAESLAARFAAKEASKESASGAKPSAIKLGDGNDSADPVRVMPAYSDAVVSDKEAADIYAFLQTLSGRRPAKDFPILNN